MKKTKQNYDDVNKFSQAEFEAIKNSTVGVSPVCIKEPVGSIIYDSSNKSIDIEFPAKKTVGSIIYDSYKKGIGIAFPAAMYLTKGKFLLSAATGLGFSFSCILGDLGDQYGGPAGRVIGRVVGNVNKYMLTALVGSDLDIKSAQKGPSNIVKMSAAAAIVGSDLDIKSAAAIVGSDLDIKSAQKGPSNIVKMSAAAANGGLSGFTGALDLSPSVSAVSTIAIEVIESAIKEKTLKGIKEGVNAGITLNSLIFIYPITSKALDAAYDVAINLPDYLAAVVNPTFDYLYNKWVETVGSQEESLSGQVADHAADL